MLVDQEDAQSYKEGEEVTLLRWGNVKITTIEKGADGKVTALRGEHDPNATNFSKTKKATWIADVVRDLCACLCTITSRSYSNPLSHRPLSLQPQLVPVRFVEFDHIISKAKLTEEDKFQDYVNLDSKFEVRAACSAGRCLPAVRIHIQMADHSAAAVLPSPHLPSPPLYLPCSATACASPRWRT